MKLARREKYFLLAGVVFIGIFCLFQFLIFPFFETRRKVQRSVSAKETCLQELGRLSTEYHRYRRSSQGMKQVIAERRKGFTLFSFLEGRAGDAGVKAYIKYMKPSVSTGVGSFTESLIEMKLEAITLNQLIGYLYRIESYDHLVSIKRMSIKENKKKSGSLDAILQVLTFEERGKG
jgi:general secretion pathway protein M